MRVLTSIMPLLLAAGLLAASGGAGGGTPVLGGGVVPGPARWPEMGTMYFVGPGVRPETGSVSVATAAPAPPQSAGADLAAPDDPYLGRQWGLEQIRRIGALHYGANGRGVLVAVLDTGVDSSHEDIAGRVVVAVNFTGSPGAGDVSGHGTHVAGIIAANSDNGKGIAGMAPESRIMSVKIADDRGVTRTTAVAEGIMWAVDSGANVINISVEFEEPSAELEKAVIYAWKKGAVIVAAAGNQGNRKPVYPAYYEDSIAVAGSTRHDALAPLSNHGDWVDAVAPGFDIYSTLPQDSYGYRSGTSFATAYVSGLAALLFGIATDTNGNGRVNDEVRAAIEAGCQQFGDVEAGRIDVPNSLGWLIRR